MKGEKKSGMPLFFMRVFLFLSAAPAHDEEDIHTAEIKEGKDRGIDIHDFADAFEFYDVAQQTKGGHQDAQHTDYDEGIVNSGEEASLSVEKVGNADTEHVEHVGSEEIP